MGKVLDATGKKILLGGKKILSSSVCCPRCTVKLSLRGVTKCPGCITIGEGIASTIQWTPGGPSLDVDFCCGYAGGCVWGGTYPDPIDITGSRFIDQSSGDCAFLPESIDNGDYGWLECLLVYDPIALTWTITVIVQIVSFGLGTGIEIFKAVVDAATCNIEIDDIANLYTTCGDFSSFNIPYGPPVGIASDGTATLIPGGC